MAIALCQDLDVIVSVNACCSVGYPRSQCFMHLWGERFHHNLESQVLATVEHSLAVNLVNLQGPLVQDDDFVPQI